jgi:hypothetical protein
MECQGIREKLSIYLEGIVTPEEKQWIEKHLDSCDSCRDAFKDLQKTRDLLGKLEEVEPPAWMTRKIMARVAQQAERRRGIFQRLFYPLHIKIPIEALAMVFIAVIAVYVYRAVEPEIKQAAVPPPASSPAIEGKAARADEKPFSPRLVEEPPAAKKEQAPAEGYREKKKKARMADRQELSPSQTVPPEISREKGTMAFSAADKEVQEPMGRGAALKMERGAAKRGGPFAIRLSVQKNELARKQIEGILQQLEAREIGNSAGRKRKEVIAEMKGEKLNLFLQKLGEIGEIKEKDLPEKIPQGNIAIRIEIITAP